MTEEERAALPSFVDQAVSLETVQGDRLTAQVLFVFDEGETPDLFCEEVTPGADGSWVKKEPAGMSILLSDIVHIRPIHFRIGRIADLPESNQ